MRISSGRGSLTALRCIDYGDWVPPPPATKVDDSYCSAFSYIQNLNQVAEMAHHLNDTANYNLYVTPTHLHDRRGLSHDYAAAGRHRLTKTVNDALQAFNQAWFTSKYVFASASIIGGLDSMFCCGVVGTM